MSRENDKSWGNFTPRNYGNAQCGNNLVFKSANMLSNMPDGCIVSLRNGSDTVRGDFGGIRIFDGGVEKTYFKIKVFRDDDITSPLGSSDIVYLYMGTSSRSGFYFTYYTWDASEPDSLCKYNKDGSKMLKNGIEVPIFNPTTKIFELDCYLYHEYFPDHPTKPPYVEDNIYHPAEWWDEDAGDGGAYWNVDEGKLGSYVLVSASNAVQSFYRNLSEESKNLKKWSRVTGNTMWDALPENEKRVKPSNIAIPLPYVNWVANGTVPPSVMGEWTLKDGETIRNSGSIKTSLPFAKSYIAKAYRTPYVANEATIKSDDGIIDISTTLRTLNYSGMSEEMTSLDWVSYGITLTNYTNEVTYGWALVLGWPTVSATAGYVGTYEYSTWHLGEDPPSF